jgi:L,D-transpeptidase ErfK/SrfK
MSFRTDRPLCSRAPRLAPALLLASLAGCSLLRPPPSLPPPPPVAPPPAPAPVLERAVATHRFTFDPARDDVVGTVQVTTTGPEDTLPDIARRFNVGYEEIVRANPGVDPWLPGAGREVVVPTRFVLPDAPRDGLVINVAAMRIYYFPKRAKGELQTVITHPIGIGKVGWQTPEGVTKVVARVQDPIWVPPASVRKEHLEDGDVLPAKVPAGPDNPLGAYMFRLGWPSYLIHGTNKPYGVGMRSSHGCVRLYPEDIALLYDLVPLGTALRVVNQPYLLGWRGETLYVQAYGALEDDKRDWQHGPQSLSKKSGHTPLWQRIKAHDADIDWERARALSDPARGIPVSVMKRDADSLAATVARAHRVRNALPDGATWDGQSGLLVDEKQFAEMIGSREPAATPPPAPAPAPPSTPARAPASASPPASAQPSGGGGGAAAGARRY